MSGRDLGEGSCEQARGLIEDLRGALLEPGGRLASSRGEQLADRLLARARPLLRPHPPLRLPAAL